MRDGLSYFGMVLDKLAGGMTKWGRKPLPFLGFRPDAKDIPV